MAGTSFVLLDILTGISAAEWEPGEREARNEEMGRQLPAVLPRPGVKEDSPHDALNV